MKTFHMDQEDFLVGSEADMKKNPVVKSHRHPRVLLSESGILAREMVKEHGMQARDDAGHLLSPEQVADRAVAISAALYRKIVAANQGVSLPELNELATGLKVHK